MPHPVVVAGIGAQAGVGVGFNICPDRGNLRKGASSVINCGARSILNPVSLVALSVQLRLIWLEETAVATRVLGAGVVVGCTVVVVVGTVVVVGRTVVVVGRTWSLSVAQ